VVPPGIDVSL